jgi:hypothetical protein
MRAGPTSECSCIPFTAHAEVNEFVDYLGAHNVKHGQVWLDIETNPSPGCGWGIAEDLTTGYKNETLGESNCAFVGELISALRARGEVPGTYVSDGSRHPGAVHHRCGLFVTLRRWRCFSMTWRPRSWARSRT